MKKFTPLIMLCMCLLLSNPVYAYSDTSTIVGYTKDGIFYEAITLEMNSSLSLYGNADIVTLTKEITFTGMVTPNESLSWTETINGTTYSGTMYLQNYYYYAGETVATYKGTLYAQ